MTKQQLASALRRSLMLNRREMRAARAQGRPLVVATRKKVVLATIKAIRDLKKD